MNAAVEEIILPYPVPYAAQVASPDLAGDFFDRGRPLVSDPRWAASGAATPQDYAYWADRACGVACVKMAVEAFGGPVQVIARWVQQGLAADGYIIRPGEDGQPVDVGWSHAALAGLIRPYAADCWVQAGSLEDIAQQVASENLVIASVSYEIGTSGPITRRGGHLVVITGLQRTGGQAATVYVHNPSGRSLALRQHARIDADRFLAAASGRLIVAQPPSQQ
jgi:hypothetical protein